MKEDPDLKYQEGADYSSWEITGLRERLTTKTETLSAIKKLAETASASYSLMNLQKLKLAETASASYSLMNLQKLSQHTLKNNFKTFIEGFSSILSIENTNTLQDLEDLNNEYESEEQQPIEEKSESSQNLESKDSNSNKALDTSKLIKKLTDSSLYELERIYNFTKKKTDLTHGSDKVLILLYDILNDYLIYHLGNFHFENQDYDKAIEYLVKCDSSFIETTCNSEDKREFYAILTESHFKEASYRKCFDWALKLKHSLEASASENKEVEISKLYETYITKTIKYSSLLNKSERRDYSQSDFNSLVDFFKLAFSRKNLSLAEKIFYKIERVNKYHEGDFFDSKETIEFYLLGGRLQTMIGNFEEALNLYTYLKVWLEKNEESNKDSKVLVNMIISELSLKVVTKESFAAYLDSLLSLLEEVKEKGDVRKSIEEKAANLTSIFEKSKATKELN
eukprot:CAMPEP_0170538270 /NCGR_PEP_ID=MMETSP0209-20121228/103209_1 /TAXON_ID=665100 ORGANISM="Litonotus pictus, Strain P1" /NCGR_SAMPLE_ID=MMETSP0209 /ASSEMBLY_ACC=CAM_ASM_000301 /LENGTH=452 /DNA_ID=CAMNT_0010839927 /DNA_START=830 /DNA_END=2185 /DNA_ORIENTATION=+